MYILLALVTGGTVIITIILNAKLAEKVGILASTFVNYLVGLLGSILLYVVINKGFGLQLLQLNDIPLLYLTGGLFGVAIVMMNSAILPKIPVVYTTILIFSGELIIGIFMDYFYFNQVPTGKIIGGVFILLGILYNMKVDKAQGIIDVAP
ncbi:DMT family transporter [Clostridium sp. DL1XJH146]